MGEDTELFLIPIRTGGENEFVFWAYAAMRGAVAHVTEMVDTGRIPLVFDLDETLVQANTIFSLRNKSMQLASDIAALKEDSMDHSARVAQLEKESEMLNEDMKQLQSFLERDRIEVNGQVIHASHEYVTGDDGQDFLRPLIRLSGKMFTRIDPKRNETSMLIRIRAGWDSLSAYLRGENTLDRRQRFKIWVCTAAERSYALEAWRLLDPSAELIPQEEVKRRLICAGKQKKSLFRTFNLGPLHDEPFPERQLCPKKKLGPLTEGHSEMAMAIIADDRIDVWERRNQDQILRISPYQYSCSNEDDAEEIHRLLKVLQSVRSQFYYELLEQMAPTVREMLKSGICEEDQMQKLRQILSRAASIAPFLVEMLNPPVVPPPEQSIFAEASLKPNDRRGIHVDNQKKAEDKRAVNRKRKNPRTGIDEPEETARPGEAKAEATEGDEKSEEMEIDEFQPRNQSQVTWRASAENTLQSNEQKKPEEDLVPPPPPPPPIDLPVVESQSSPFSRDDQIPGLQMSVQPASRLIPGKDLLQRPPTEMQDSRYRLVRMVDGRVVLQQVAPEAEFPRQLTQYIVQHSTVTQTQSLQPQQMQIQPQFSHNIARQTSRNAVVVPAAAPAQQAGLPHQLEVAQGGMTMVQAPNTFGGPDQTTRFFLLSNSQASNVIPQIQGMAGAPNRIPTSQPDVFLDNHQQIHIYPQENLQSQKTMYCPPPSQSQPPQVAFGNAREHAVFDQAFSQMLHIPHTEGHHRDGLLFQGIAQISGNKIRGRPRFGVPRGGNKRQKPLGFDGRLANQSSRPYQAARPRRGPSTRRGQRKQFGRHKFNQTRKQRRLDNHTAQDFNLTGYTAQLEDGLGDREMSEEGEIRQ